MKCCICGPVRNCEPYLDKVFQNIQQVGSLFDDYKIVIFYDKSTDNTLNKLKNYQKHPLYRDKLLLYVNQTIVSPYRTHRLAYARNFCLNYIRDNNEYDYFVMMDFDDVNCKNINLNVLRNALTNPALETQWDALSFDTAPLYYDIWALSIYPYCFSYNHFKYSSTNSYTTLQEYVTNKLRGLKKGQLLRCISSFNGFAIYKTSVFIRPGIQYDGNVRFDLLPKEYLKAHMSVANSGLIFPDFGHVKAAYEDCEHRAFHISAINNANARIMISPEKLFT